MAVTAGRASTTRRRVRDAAWRDCPSGEWPVNRFGTNAAAGGLDGLRREAENIRSDLEKSIVELRQRLHQESRERSEADAEFQRRLADVAVGGLHLEVIGLFWLLLATVATSIPEELGALF